MKILEKEFEKKALFICIFILLYICVCVWVRFFNFEFYPTLFFFRICSHLHGFELQNLKLGCV